MATVTAATARAVLDLYAEVFTARTGTPCPTGIKAHQGGLGPVLMVPDSMALAADGDKIYHCDTNGNGHPAIVLEADAFFCDDDCDISGCWTNDVQAAANERGLEVHLEPYSNISVGIYLP